MGRTVSAVVTCGHELLGATKEFTVDSPWWADVGPVAGVLTERLGVAVVVLRLLRTDGTGGRDGHVTYHVQAAEPPTRGLVATDANHAELVAPQRFRVPWATSDGLRELLGWATGELAAAGRPVTGPVEQHRTWNLAGLFRLPTARGPVWLKATPHFATDEATAIAAIARHDPGLAPLVLAAGAHRMLLEHIPGEDCWDAPEPVVTRAVRRFVAVQTALADQPSDLPDRRDLADRVRALLDDHVPELTAAERAAARRLTGRWAELDACGLPDTLVHGDFHPGNWRGEGPVVLDLADAHLGNPVLDALRAADYLGEPRATAAVRAWAGAWAAARPGSDPARALAAAEPLAHLAYAVRYQEFLDGIEPSERIYHEDDPATVIRTALRVAEAPSSWAAVVA